MRPPCHFEGLQIEALYSFMICVFTCVWQWVGGRWCLDKPRGLLAVMEEKANGLNVQLQITASPPDHYHYRFSYRNLPVMLLGAGRKMTLRQRRVEEKELIKRQSKASPSALL